MTLPNHILDEIKAVRKAKPPNYIVTKSVNRIRPGKLLKIAIHFALDCVDAFIRPRARHKLWIIEKIKTCGACKQREKLIDQYALHLISKLFERKVAQ